MYSFHLIQVLIYKSLTHTLTTFNISLNFNKN